MEHDDQDGVIDAVAAPVRRVARYLPAALLVVLVLGGLVYAMSRGDENRSSLAPASVSEPTATTSVDSSVPEPSTTDVEVSTSVNAEPASSSPEAGHQGGGQGGGQGGFDPTRPGANIPGAVGRYCGTHVIPQPSIPSVVGGKWPNLISEEQLAQFMHYSECNQVAYVMLRLNPIGTVCTQDPNMVDRVAAQGAVPGTLLAPGTIAPLDLTLYALCDPPDTTSPTVPLTSA